MRRWLLVMAVLLWGCAGVPMEGAREKEPSPAPPPPRKVLRRVKVEAYASYAQGVLLEARADRLLAQARRLAFLDETLAQEKRRQAAECWVQSRQALERAVELDPEGLAPLRRLALALAQRGEFEEAIPYLERIVTVAPRDFHTRAELARRYETMDRLLEARREYRLVLRTASGASQDWLVAKVYLPLARVSEQLYGLAAAVEPLAGALDAGAEARLVEAAARRLVVSAQKEEDFIERAEKAVRAESRGFGFQYLMGWIAFARRDWAASAAYLERAVEAKPDSWPAYVHRCLALAELGEVEEALAELEEAPRSDLEPGTVEILKGSILLGARRYQEARQTLEEAVRLAPRNILVRHQLAGAYEKLGRLDDAIEMLKVNLTLDPNHAGTLNALGYFYAEKSVRLAEAEQLIRRALFQEPDNGAYLDSLGWVFFKQGRLDQALEVLTRAAQRSPDPVIYEHLGDVYLEHDQPQEAARWWERALEQDPEAASPRRKLEALRARGSSQGVPEQAPQTTE